MKFAIAKKKTDFSSQYIKTKGNKRSITSENRFRELIRLFNLNALDTTQPHFKY